MRRIARLLFPCLITLFVSFSSVGQAPPDKTPKEKAEYDEKLKIIKNHFAEAIKLHAEGKTSEARTTLEKSLVLIREALGESSVSLPEPFEWLTVLCLESEDFAAAKDYANKALAARKQLNGESHWKTTDARLMLAEVELLPKLTKEQRTDLHKADQIMEEVDRLKVQGKYQQAGELAEKVLSIRRTILGEKNEHYARTLNNLAVLFKLQGLFAKAEQLYKESVAIKKEVLGLNHPDYALTVNNLANLYRSQSLFAKAEPLFMEVMAIRKGVFGEKHPDYAQSLNDLGVLYHLQGLFLQAEPFFKQALAIREKVPGIKHPDYAVSLNNLGELYRSNGMFAKAEPLFKQALAIRKEVLGVKHEDYANSLNSLALLYGAQGLFEKAEGLYKEALAIRKEDLGEKNPNYALTLDNLAALYYSQDFLEQAEALHARALAIRKEVLGTKHPDYITSLNNLALIYSDRADSPAMFVKAEAFLMEAMTINKEVLGKRHPNYASSLNNLAFLYYRSAQFEKAEPLYREALAIRKEVLGENHLDYVTSLNNLALLYGSQGLVAKAEPLFKQAIGIMERQLEETAASQSETGQLAYTARTRFYLNNLLSLKGTNTTDLYDIAFRWRGAVTARQAFSRAAHIINPSPVIRDTLKDLRTVAVQLSNLVHNPPKPGSGVNVIALREELNDRRDNLEKKLGEVSKEFDKYLAYRKLTPAEVQKLLPENAALVDFLAYKDKIATFVITRKEIVRVDLMGGSELTELIQDFRNPLSLKRTRPVQENDESELYKTVWEPLLPHLGDSKLILICPDGPLCQLPFAALRGKDPKKYLIEEVAIAVIPVPRMLPVLLAKDSAKPNTVLSLLAIGDVDFGPGRSWDPLAGTKSEIETIENLFRQGKPNAAFKTLTRGNATQATIRNVAGNYRYLHFATHGFFNTATPRLKLEGRGEGLSGEQNRMSILNPNLLCGLVCAGANKPKLDDDGRLTALEIMDLDLSGVELAVLSACETGLGKIEQGDGVMGLQRAFQLAGVRTTVTSLWKVPDAATSSLMIRFYENKLMKSMPTLEALREAQLWVLNNGVKAGILAEEPKNGRRTPPLYWAAFTLAGDWR